MNNKPLVIGVSGGTASGKTSICEIIMEEIGKERCALLQLDSFYKPLTKEQNKNLKDYNFDHPNALDFELVEECLEKLIKGTNTEVPLYDFKTNDRCGEKVLESASVILFEGILVFYQEQIRNLMDLKIFVSTDDDVRLGRRMVRDIKERGRTVESVISQYNTTVKKSYDEFVKPTMKHADIIIPRGRDNIVGIDCVVNDIKLRIRTRKIGIKSECAWLLSPKLGGKISQNKLLNFFEAEETDEESVKGIYRVANKLLSNEEPTMRHIWIEYLLGKLITMVIMREKLLKHSFEIIGDRVENKAEIAIMFKSAILSESTLEEIYNFSKELKAKKLVVATLYSSPSIMEKVKETDKIKIYVLICNSSATEYIDLLSNKSSDHSSPTEEEYNKVFTEQLGTLSV